MSVTINTDQMRLDLLVTALEGGSNYWYYISKGACKRIDEVMPSDGTHSFAERMWEAIKAGKSIPIRDAEDPQEKLGEINLASIERGEQTMADKYNWHFANIIEENWDAETADVWFQCAVMNEIVYG